MKMKILPAYVPKPEDLAWARQQISLLRDGGYIGTSTGTYKIDKVNKKIILVDPTSPFDNVMTLCLHHRHHYVFKELDYTVEPVVQWDRMEVPDEPEPKK